jgi:murein DD-endopeptidase MepM/ murein hydrolase activator NlpD
VLAVGALDAQLAAAPSAAQSRQLLIPVQNIRPADLTDTYSDSRGGGTRLHEALDIMAPKGTSVLSSAPGMIEKLFRSKAGGNTIYVRSTDGETIYYYAHLDAYAEGLREGQRVRRGQRLGMVGSSGNASAEAPHLHFAILQTTADAEWWEPANAVNPYPLLTAD